MTAGVATSQGRNPPPAQSAGSPSEAGTASPREEAPALVRCHQLVVGWKARALLPAIDLTIRRGRFIAVVGRNGAGKSTFFKTLLGESTPVAGSIERCPSLKRIAYVPQSDSFDRLLPLRAWDVVMQGRLYENDFLRPVASSHDRAVCKRALDEAGASDVTNHHYRELSRGQRQRVMFARMLATEAQLALLDEPTAAMDRTSERDAMQRLADLTQQHNIAVVCISHAIAIAEQYADDILLLDRNRQIVAFGTRGAILQTPAYQDLLEGTS